MALGVIFSEDHTWVVSAACCLLILSLLSYLFRKPAFSPKAPSLDTESYPILGSIQFFTQRWDFYQRAMARSHRGNFSFYAGQWPIVAVSGDEARKTFFEHKGLGFSEGYAALLGGSPTVQKEGNPFSESHAEETGFSAYFNKRVIAMLKGNRLAQGLPLLLNDARGMLDELAAKPSGMTDPFDSIYKMVFKFTMRTVACNEIANDPALLDETLDLYEAIEETATPLSIMYPWLPTPAKFRRYFTGMKLYRIFNRVIEDRKKNDRRENDALQYLLDEGDGIIDIIQFVMGALFAGQLNSGINSAWVLVYLARDPSWLEKVRQEVDTVASRYSSDEQIPLKERLMSVPADAWEGEFPIVDACLKDSIRLAMSGNAFRKNMTGSDIPLNKAGTEVIPKDAYVTYAAGDIHYNPDIYENPDEWDPSRYDPDRAEDKKRIYTYMGWGGGRHPCLGMRFAKMEMSMIVAFFVAYFDDIRLCDGNGAPTVQLPKVDRNRHTAHKPHGKVYLKYKVRND